MTMKKKLVILGVDHPHYIEIIKAAEKCSDIELTAIAHETNNSANKIAEKYGVKSYDSYEQCLTLEKPDVAGIAMFNGARGRWVTKCLEMGTAVIADKPLCTNLEDLRKIDYALQEYKTPLSMMLTCRCDPRFVAIRNKIRNGAIGDILSVDGVRYYALNRPARPDWMFDDKFYGGPGLDILIHDYDLARWITGIEWNEIDMDEIRTGLYADKDFKDIAFLSSVDNNRVLNLKMLWHSPAKHWDRFTVYGTKGFIELPLAAGQAVLVDGKGEVEPIEFSKVKPFGEQFFHALVNNDDTLMPISIKDILSISYNILKARR